MKNAIAVAVMSVSLLFGTVANAQEDEARTEKAGKIGCGVGAVVGGLLGNKLFKDHKAMGTVAGAGGGCAAGNFFGKKLSKAKQLKEFKEAQQQAQAAGLKSTVVEKDGTNEQGKPAKELGKMVVAYSPKDMLPVAASTVPVFDKLASITSRSTNKLTFTFSGVTACEVPLIELQKRNAFQGKGVQHKVVNNCGHGASEFVVSPIPDVK
ncbi:glycine zipper 2TM domain-containing protein [Pseudoxanthomonas winnipegensis]|uniref:Glycine zipper 2TM domain-containing protein n=1 Tax=Pseudoxanthomonas winnipegensis TaxID=2480810 RepID=A0A4Q8M450_9GAMM|nr:glycine zipper 2TM domain-containing protein [Pseudoxanthomonas winnipegensis]TAA41530.1 glycine zipper 2TM domain-containing protein [Pseudoxanthomonas winnipegensis]